MGAHLFQAIDYFFKHASLPVSWGKTHIVLLITKNASSKRDFDYKSISLYNVCYIVISKLLSNSLKFVIHKLLGPEESGFLASRSIVDNILALQEVALPWSMTLLAPLGLKSLMIC